MKNTTTSVFLLIYLFSQAQVYNGSVGNIMNNGQSTYFNATVSGLSPSQLDSSFGIENVKIKINHPALEQLSVHLESPSGTLVRLIVGSSVSGADYNNTSFDSRVNTAITSANAPFNGTYKPIGYLGRFNTGQVGNGVWKLIVKDYLANVDAGNLISWSIQFGNSPSPPVDFQSSNLPIVKINTNNQKISEDGIIANMGIIYNGNGQRNNITDVANDYNGVTQIKLHGTSSLNYEKKSFTLETHDAMGNALNVSILGMPAESDWLLIASYSDKTLIRNPLTYHLSRQLGHYATRFKHVEVILNGEYWGVYALVEKIKRGADRVNVEKLKPTENIVPDILGGYILQIDRNDEPGWNSLLPGNSSANAHFFYQYIYPKDTVISAAQKNYIKSVLDSFELAMNGSSFADPINGYPKYLDVESFIDFFIINELSKNVDAFRLSTYLYKDKFLAGGKIHIGPVWDFDLAWHNCNYGGSSDYHNWQYVQVVNDYPVPKWWTRFIQDDNFKNMLYCRWQFLRQNLLKTSSLKSFIDSTAAVLNESEQRNFTQFPILGTYIWPNPQSQSNASYQTEVNDLKNWITNRIGWMDGNMAGSCSGALASVSISQTSGTNPMCENRSVTFTAVPVNGGATPAYQWKVDGVNLGTNSPTFTTSLLTNGQQVSCVMTSGVYGGGSNQVVSNSITMTVNATPAAPVASVNSPVCAGDSINLTTPDFSGTFSWTGPGSFTSALQNPVRDNATIAMTGTYSVAVTSGGCKSDPGVISLVVDPAPVVAQFSDIAVCSGTALTINAFNSIPAGATFSWTNSNTAIGIAESGSGSVPGFMATNSGSTQLVGVITVIPTLNGCKGSSAEFSVTINPQPISPFTQSEDQCLSGNSFSFINTGGTGTYFWKFTGGGPGTSSSNNPVDVTFTTAGTHSILHTVTGIGGCSSTTTSVITIYNSPTALEIVSTNSTCSGANGSIYIGAVTGGLGPYTYSVNGSGYTGSKNYTDLAAGSYPVVVKGSNECIYMTSASVANTGLIPATPVVSQVGLILTASSFTGNQWYLDGMIIPGANGHNYTVTENGSYTVTDTDNGCVSAASVPVNIFGVGMEEAGNPYVLDIFPNPNDGNFVVSFTAIEKSTYKLELKNALGQLIYKETVFDYSGTFTKRINISKNGKGVYTIGLTNSKKEILKKIIVIQED